MTKYASVPPGYNDGYTLGLGGIASHAISPTLYAKLPFNARSDFTFVSTMWQLPNMLVVNLDLPAKTVAELIELLKKNPGKYSYASAGNGTTLHLSGGVPDDPQLHAPSEAFVTSNANRRACSPLISM